MKWPKKIIRCRRFGGCGQDGTTWFIAPALIDAESFVEEFGGEYRVYVLQTPKRKARKKKAK